jgi:hypothetical protein
MTCRRRYIFFEEGIAYDAFYLFVQRYLKKIKQINNIAIGYAIKIN